MQLTNNPKNVQNFVYKQLYTKNVFTYMSLALICMFIV